MKGIALLLTTIFLSSGLPAAGKDSRSDQFWAQWRGPRATGVAPHGNPPIHWSETRNIGWKVEIPGQGLATPIVWDDKVFVLSAIPTSGSTTSSSEQPSRRRRRGPPKKPPTQAHQFTIFAIKRSDGRILWKRVLREELPHEGTHATATWASASPVTDGENVYAHFGSRGLYCLSMSGDLLWEKDLGDMRIRLQFGEGSSPVLYGDKIIVNWDHEGQSFIVALDKKTGREIWRNDREEMTSWSTPIVVARKEGAQVITSATHRVRSYDVDSGKLIWQSEGMTLNTIPSPVAADGMVFVASGFRGNALLAIRLAAARGDITGSNAIPWRYDRDTPYTPSPLLYGDSLYFLKGNNGVLTNIKSRTGEVLYGPSRLEDISNVYASPVGAAGRVYIVGREGASVVVEHGNQFKILAVNRLDDGFDASPAVVDDEIYLRGKRHLYRISKD